VLHVHTPYATAVACLADPEIKPIDQNTARFYNRVAYYRSFQGFVDDQAEGERVVRALGSRSTMLMSNHGVLVAAETAARAFDTLFYLERACRTLALAYSTDQKLKVLSPKVAEQTAREWETYGDMAPAHFAAMKTILDSEEPSYAD
jgi:ribulose-5-phosphate 4-epimerase/fuculose-1-phosphate aldolase